MSAIIPIEVPSSFDLATVLLSQIVSHFIAYTMTINHRIKIQNVEANKLQFLSI